MLKSKSTVLLCLLTVISVFLVIPAISIAQDVTSDYWNNRNVVVSPNTAAKTPVNTDGGLSSDKAYWEKQNVVISPKLSDKIPVNTDGGVSTYWEQRDVAVSPRIE